MSAMATFLRYQYELGNVTKAQLQLLVDKKITPAEFAEIVGEEEHKCD